MAKFRVAVTDYVFPDLSIEREMLAAAGAELVAAQCESGADVVALAADADAILNTYYGPLDEAVIAACGKLRVIVRFGIGVDTIDIAAATRHGVMVANVPDYCLEEVSNHAVALWLALARKVCLADRSVRRGDWTLAPLKPMPELRGQTVGIIGFGRIGRLTAGKLAAFGVQIVFADPYADAEVVEINGAPCHRVELDELCAVADAVLVHAPATAQTRQLLDARRFAQMRRKPLVVNTARAELIDTAALVEALRDGQVRGAALDLVDDGRLAADHPLLSFENVVLTPHSAWYSEAAIGALRRLATAEVVRVLQGESPKSLLNPEVLHGA